MERTKKDNRLPIFTERFRKLAGDLSITDFADFLGLSRQTVGFYYNGDRLPDVIRLLRIAEKCDVSTDYLLGKSDVKTADPEIQSICDYTGLSEESIDVLLDSVSLSDSLNTLLQYRAFSYLLLAVTQYEKMVTAASIYRNVPNTCGDEGSRSTEVLSYMYEQNMPDDIRRAVSVYDHSVSMLEALREGQRLLSDGEFGSTFDEAISPSDIYESNANKNLVLLLEEIASDATLQGLILTGKVK